MKISLVAVLAATVASNRFVAAYDHRDGGPLAPSAWMVAAARPAGNDDGNLAGQVGVADTGGSGRG